MRTIIICLSIGLLLGLGAVAARAQEPISPVLLPLEINAAQADLGRKLFFDPRLSKSGFISCNSCHNLSMGGTDNLPTSIGHGWNQGPINAPTVLNATFNLAQFWDGRAEDLQAQAGGPIANPGEMASTHTLAIDVLGSIPGYVNEFGQAFGSPGIDIARVTAAIAEFEKTLVTPNSRFDQWLQGDTNALTEQEHAGYALFKSTGCTACHRGPAVGGEAFMKFGIVSPYETRSETHGRIAVTGQANDLNVFKVPTLRNIELTYPYFHDGAVSTLDEAVDIMARIQLGRVLNDDEVGSIVDFLRTLTGEQPQFALPILPPSTAQTPLPVPFN
jgi:cytochrome c peroxidase